MAQPAACAPVALADERLSVPSAGPLSSPLGRAWRVLATGISFAAFGLGGLLLGGLALPLISLFSRDPRTRVVRSRSLIGCAFRAFIGLMRTMGVLTWEIRDGQRLSRSGLLVLANHPTLLDVVFLAALVPNANCVVKTSLARNPFTRGPVRAAGFLFNDEGAGLVADCIESLRSGDNLILFPEGTRTPEGIELGAFQRGAANIAVRGRRAITPVLIRCDPPTLKKGQSWYNVPLCRMHFSLEVLPDWTPTPRAGGGADALLARDCAAELRSHFLEELRCAGSATRNQAADHFSAQP